MPKTISPHHNLCQSIFPSPSLSEPLLHNWRQYLKKGGTLIFLSAPHAWKAIPSLTLGHRDRERRLLFLHKKDAMLFMIGRHLVSLLSDDSRKLTEMKYTDLGKPYIDGYYNFNISHCDSFVACAFSSQGPVGLDIESSQNLDWAIHSAHDIFTHHEQLWLSTQSNWPTAFLDVWTRKEAVLKFLGTGFLADFQTVETHPERKNVRMTYDNQEISLENRRVIMGSHTLHLACASLATKPAPIIFIIPPV